MKKGINLPWIDASNQLPFPFDICLLDLDGKIISGWWTGQTWDGMKYEGQKVYYWKRLIT